MPRAVAGGGRLAALDRMRGFVVGLVVLHHSVLAYCTFGHVDRLNFARSTAPIVDPRRWVGFDDWVRLGDAVFMPLLFLLSGLFVRDELVRKGAGPFLRARFRRLGIPFAVAELSVVPLAYYPSYLQAGGAPGFVRFWFETLTTGPSPSGPPWFLAVLLLFDAAAALVFALAPRRGATPWMPSPACGFALLLAGSCLLYLPLLVAVGPVRWFGIGPFAIQGSRIGLYAADFAAGVALGLGGLPAVTRFGRAIAMRWAVWVPLAALAGAAFLGVGAVLAGREVGWPVLALWGTAQMALCAAAIMALPALFLRFADGRAPILDSLAENGFAIYLLHYPAVTWTQSALLNAPLGAPAKAAVTFVVALGATWSCSGLLRRRPATEKGP